MAEGIDIEHLKGRLAKFGVNVNVDGVSPSKNLLGSKPNEQVERARRDVFELLGKFQGTKSNSKAASADVNRLEDKNVRLEISDKQARDNIRERRQKPALASSKGTAKVHTQAAKAAHVSRLDNATLQSFPSGSSLASILSQYKEAETAWNQEKAKLRREVAEQRKRSNCLEIENKRLQQLHDNKADNFKALRAALSTRDSQLHDAYVRIKDLEEVIKSCQDENSAKIAAVAAERDDLKALLLATLSHLEAVDQLVVRAGESSTAMEQKLRALDEERTAALDAASRARAEVAELNESRRRLQWQGRLLERMAEVQQKHGRSRGAEAAASGLLDPGMLSDLLLDGSEADEHALSDEDSLSLLGELARKGYLNLET